MSKFVQKRLMQCVYAERYPARENCNFQVCCHGNTFMFLRRLELTQDYCQPSKDAITQTQETISVCWNSISSLTTGNTHHLSLLTVSILFDPPWVRHYKHSTQSQSSDLLKIIISNANRDPKMSRDTKKHHTDLQIPFFKLCKLCFEV